MKNITDPDTKKGQTELSKSDYTIVIQRVKDNIAEYGDDWGDFICQD